jgi:alpha,alpha-trehalose phosphorylase
VPELVDRCRRTLDRAIREGFDTLVTSQRANLDRFWDRADVRVHARLNPVRHQQAIRWNLYHVAQASWRAEGAGIPAKGLTGQAYEGHFFWDTEIYVLPFLSYTQPRLARNLLRFRHSMLDRARERAHDLSQRGALFPWRTIDGEEASSYFQAGTAQYHINADIAYAIKRYANIQGGMRLLGEIGAEILVETARLWEDLGFYGTDKRFHIHGVTGPDEYTTVVNDNTYTNLMARLNLNFAAATLRRLRDERPEDYTALVRAIKLQPGEPESWEREERYLVDGGAALKVVIPGRATPAQPRLPGRDRALAAMTRTASTRLDEENGAGFPGLCCPRAASCSAVPQEEANCFEGRSILDGGRYGLIVAVGDAAHGLAEYLA